MDPTFTIALTDVMKELNTENITDMDKLKDSLNELEDAALKLVDGSSDISKGADTLDDKYEEFDDGVNTLKSGIETLNSGAAQLADGIGSYTDGADQLNDGIQTYLGSSGVLTGKVTEYVNGVSTVVNGVKQYTDGAVQLADGTAAYISGEKQLAAGAEGLRPLVTGLTEIKDAVKQLNSALDGKGSTTDDIRLAADTLASGTQQLKDTLDSADINEMMELIDQMTGTGQELIEEAEGLSSAMQEKIAVPVSKMMAAGKSLKSGLGSLQTYLTTLQTKTSEAVALAGQTMTDNVNSSIAQKNDQLRSAAQNAAQNAEDTANARLQAARDTLDEQIAAADDEAVKSALTAAKNQLGSVSVSVENVEELQPVQTPAVEVEIPVFDPSEILSAMGEMTDAYQTVEAAVSELCGSELPLIQEKLAGIVSIKDQIPTAPMQTLKENVSVLNTGMQQLKGGIGKLSGSVELLDQNTSTLPQASKGIQTLLDGFQALGGADKQLLDGAAELKRNAPILVQGMGMDLMAANFFVFYFGIVADITPPVALAAYAGSAIAKAPPMRTAFNATRLAIAAFIVPYIFAFNNTMLFIGDFGPLDVVQVVLTSSVGMFLIAAGMIGYMLRDLNWGVRIVCIAAGLMLIHPGTLTDIIGIGVLVVVLVFQIITGKGSKAVKAA